MDSQASMSDFPIYSCEVRGSGAALTVFLNEYMLYSSGGCSHNFSSSLRAWMERENLFRVKIAPSVRAKAGVPVQFAVLASLVEGPERRNLVQMAFPAGVAAPDVATFPFDTLAKKLVEGQNLHFVCPAESDIVEKPWKRTRDIITSPREVFRLYAEIQQCYLDGNVARIMELSRNRITFGAQLCGMSRGDFEKRVRDDLESTFADHPHWKSVRFPEQELTVHEFLPGKVMRVLDLYGNPPLRTVADSKGMQFGYDVVLAITDEGLVWIM